MAGNRPNIVYILADDMGYGDVSCLNPDSKIRTRHLDRLGRAGMVFTDAHSSSAVCTPSRYSILTGRYNWRSTLKRGVTFGYSQPVIEDDRTTVASLLRSHGYATACVGKWHLGMDWHTVGDDPKDIGPKDIGPKDVDPEDVDFTRPVRNGPTTKGFDAFYGISASLDMPPYVYIENDRATAVPDRETQDRGMAFWRKGPTAPDFRHEDVLPRLTEKAVEFIRRNRDNPFFLYFPLPAPHTPILPLPEFKGKSKTNDYGDFCLQVDWTVARIMQALRECGIEENTILVFTADNGCSPRADFTHLAALGHRPSHHFRGHKADIYEGGHRIPLLVRWPARIQAGSTSHEVVCLCDLMATCADILGLTLPSNAGEDSVSNLPVWLGESYQTPLREATVHHSIDGSFSIRKEHWKLEMCPGSGGWSYPKPGDEPEGTPPIQLYDLSADISERANVQDKHPEIVAELKDLLTKYVVNGRSTPGAPQPNTGPLHWPQLNWLAEGDM